MPAPAQQDWIDRVDQADHIVGRIRRGESLERGSGFRTVHVFVFDPAGRLLLQKLSGFRRRNPLRWGSSVAGHLHAGESYHDAALRRLREELGLATALFKWGSIPMQDEQATKFITLYTAVVDGAPTIQEPEHIAARSASSRWTRSGSCSGARRKPSPRPSATSFGSTRRRGSLLGG